MKNNALLAVIFVIGILIAVSFTQSANSIGMIGKEKQPYWHFGEGLKPGDSFEYRICDSLLKIPESPDDCYVITLGVVALLPSPQGNTWVMSAHVDHRVRSVDFILQIPDSTFTITTDGSSIPYADSLERTLEWVMKFASNHKPQPLVVGKSWGVVASDTVPETELTVMQADSAQMGEEIIPTYKVGYSLVKDSFLQIKDDFPMPIKAVIYKPVSVFKDVPLAITFDLLRYAGGKENTCVPQASVVPMCTDYSLESLMSNPPRKAEFPANSTILNGVAEYDSLLDETNFDNSSAYYSDLESEYFDEADFRGKLKNSTTAQILEDLYGPDYEKIITSFDKFVELLTNTTNAVKNQLIPPLP